MPDPSPSTDAPAAETTQAPLPPVDFDASLELGADLLTVDWTLTNTGDQPLLVVDARPRASGASVSYDPTAAYVVEDTDETMVQVASRLFDAPETDRMSWAQAPEAGATTLAPGDTLERQVVVPYPFVRASPWGNDVGYGPIELPAPARSVRYCLGVIAGEPAPSWGLRRVGGVTVLDHGGGAVAAQHLVCSDPLQLG